MNVSITQFESFLENKGLKPRSIENYLYYFNKFQALQVFNQETVSRFLSEASNRNSIARSFLLNYQKFLLVNHVELGIAQERKIDIASVELPKITGRPKQRLVNPLSIGDVYRLEKYCKTEQMKLMLLLSFFCGLRVGGLMKITVIAFNWQKWGEDQESMGELRVFEKGDKEGVAIVPSKIMKRIAQYIHAQKPPLIENSYLFINTKRSSIKLHTAIRDWRRKLLQIAEEAGITKRDANRKLIKETVVYPHRLRHSFGSHIVNEKGLNLREAQELLRHSNISNTQIYTHINKEHLKEKLKDLDS